MPADDGEKELVSRRSSRLQLDPICKRPKVIAELTEGSTWPQMTIREEKDSYVGNACGLYSREDYAGRH
jgi:hypothetical protein